MFVFLGGHPLCPHCGAPPARVLPFFLRKTNEKVEANPLGDVKRAPDEPAKIDGDLDLSSDSTVFARDTKYLIGAQSTSLNLVGSGGPPVFPACGGVGLWG